LRIGAILLYAQKVRRTIGRRRKNLIERLTNTVFRAIN